MQMSIAQEKVNISLLVNQKNLDQILNKKYFQKIPVSDDDFLYAIFAYGMANCLMDNPEFKIFTAMMIKQGIITKIHESNVY